MEGWGKKGDPFGPRTPPLTEVIKNILERYPDGGQILKELIQNADDAGATDVKFLYDNRRHGIQSLQSPELARFQGPALYCHNNATFQEEDWEGIQNLMRSNKKDDPLKVGRFGIGFNSVYHITDFPGIVSKDTVGFLDPHETYFGRGMPGQRYDVRNNLLDPSSRDQFAPFDGIFDCDLGNAKIYDGTLFRFPLRTTPSELSKKNYTKEMVDNLFESLRKEASVILLFLKSVQSISVHERREDGEIECVFKVEVAEATRQEVKRKREEFLKEAKEPNITESKYVMNIQATFGSNTQTFNWLIVNQIDSTEKRIAELAEELHLLSWVGIAVPLDANTSNESAGRIFCFLPLTPDVDCQTGLPVHVHGYFGVTENRRGLVWPGDECQNNETGEWNELLLKKIAVEVYLKIFEALVENEPNIGIGEKERSQLVYSTLPVPGRVRGHWNVLSKHLFRKLVELNKKLFFAHKTSGYTWIGLNEGLLDRLQDCQIPRETRESILKILLSSSHVVITGLPQHVLEIVARYFSPPRDITPGVLRAVLRNQDISTTPRKEKLLLLEYVLGDDPSTDLSGVPLLPLVSGTFSKFCPNNHARTPSTSVFVPNEACRASLLPNMKHRFLDETLPDTLTAKLRAMAAEETQDGNPTQLVHLTKEIVLQNLRSSLPTAWFSGEEKVQWIEGSSNHPPESWFKVIWDWIHSSFPDSLSPFKGIPLIKLPASRNKCLGVLSPNSKFIFDSDGSGNTLPLQVTSLLTACGCTVIHDTSSYLYHPDIKSYIAPPTPVGTITVLNLTTFDTLQEYIKQTDSNDRSVIREFFCRLPEDVSIDQKRFLLRLSLFDRLDGSATPVQVNGQVLKVASPQFDLPDGFNFEKSDQIISSTTPNSYQLLSLLNVEILKPAEVLRRYLFPDIQTGSVYTTKETSGIMLWVIKQMFIFKTQRDGFQDEMKVLPFVPTDKGELKKPSELYDPNDVLLVDLFLGETTKFPTGDFANENVVPELKELGLRKRDMLTATELLEVAVKITSDPVSQTYISKAEALVKILEDNPVYPNQYVDGRVTLKDKLLRLKWLPCAKHPPKDSRFPEFMPWYDSNSSFFSPTELRSKSQVLLVGSSMPILDTEMSEELHDKLGLTSDPPLHQVISQLEIAVRSWQEQHQKKGSSQLEEMLIAIYLHLSQIPKENVSAAINNAALKQWIWQGTGFCSPPQLALEQDFPLDLRPQLFLLPDVLNDKPSLKQFFLSHGVRERFNEEDILGVLDDLRNKHEKLPPEVNASSEVERDLKLCRSILEWVVKDGETLEENLQEKVLVPVQNGRDGLVLEPCKKCTFCDQDWLRRGGSEFDIPEDYSLIHESVPVKVARLLGVPALSTCLVSAETLGFEFEQTGPHEPITTRLNNILKEYKEGVGVFKELIQNADDAGASKVRFLVDWRHGPKQKLLSPKMAECQGPALWAYNNAVFTDKDFKNINMLAGATKVKDLGKIGRFGLGFNAVYNLTDVPSFVSREYFVVFDPNVHHLEGHIKDKSRPGIRINLATNQTTLSAFEDQFQPYHNVFDCKTGQKQRGTFYYEGTLFRFPFRTSVQKKESEICQSVYDEEKVKDLVCSLKQSASLLLLYAQHVNQVELYEIKQDSSPIDMELQLSVTKNTPEILRSESRLSRTFIEECSYWWQKNLTCSDSNAVKPSRLELVTVSIRDRACSLSGSDCAPGKQETWLLTHCVGTDSSVHLAKNKGREYGLLPCAGAGVKISVITDNESDVASFFYPESVQGEAFCFLPLSIPTGLPVHLNSYFAITSNRRRIWERNTSDICQPIEVLWNESLMEDALSNAYIKLLKDMKRLSEDGTLQQYDSYMLWPCYDSLCSTTWETLVKSFYLKLVEEALPLFCSSGKWLSIHESYILDEKLWNIPQVAAILKFLKLSVLQLPSSVCTSLEKSGHGEVLDQRTLTLEKFLKQVFFPNITTLVPELRDPIICYGLDCILNEQSELVSLFKETPCITCSTDGRHLAKPRELIDPNGAAAILFSKEDHRFPVGEHFLTEKRLYVLRQLGMVKDLLTWNEICERAKSVENFQELKQGQGRARNLIKYLGEKLKNLTKINEEEQSLLRRTKFLPFKSEPPDGYFLPWKGSTRKKQFVAPVDLFLRRDQELVGSSSLIIDDSYISGCGLLDENVKELLGFSESRPEIEKVIQQLDTTIRVWSNLCDENRDRLKTWMVKCTCKNIYEYLEMFVSQKCEEQLHSEKQEEKPDSGLATLFSKDWLFIQGKFVPTKNVAYKWNRNGAPFLYSLPYDYSKEYHNLLREAGVKQAFDENDFIQALYALQETKKSIPLNEEELKLAACFLNELKDVNNDTIKKHVGKIPLPDINKVLHQSDNLTINLNFWLKDREEDRRYVHRDIPQELALDLGARSLQSRILKKYSSTIGTSFGQHENLTDRLKNILKSYPCDSGILKELVQNADDAQASEIHFVYDTRVHPSERVIQKNAIEIQGPALCVYNDRPFTDKDLEGIKKLGIGSKGNDPENIGRYGVGFNAVYHLTDCPSFISNDDTLVLLDPHCRYTTEAMPNSPGGIFQPIDEEFRKSFCDVLVGYLGEHFDLKGSTMFRLPLRNSVRSPETADTIANPISDPISDEKMKDLLHVFQDESRKMLLFLDHIKKITLSRIGEDKKLERIYQVESTILKREHKEQLKTISSMAKAYKDTATNKIPWKGATYPTTISDDKGVVAKWLVHQCCGAHPECQKDDGPTPDGRQLGLFPRGGIATLVSCSTPVTSDVQSQNIAYCSLPLPIHTSLPVLVNGHFALGSSRRVIWRDTEPYGELTKWNDFLKLRVLAPGYAALIREAKRYIPRCKYPRTDSPYFPDSETTENGLDWYHKLFPNVSIESEWKPLAVEVYRFLGITRAPVLPVVVVCEDTKDRNKHFSRSTKKDKAKRLEMEKKLPRKIRSWFPADESFFMPEQPKHVQEILKLLLRICFPLLINSPHKLYNGFREAGITCRLANPKNTIDFLRQFRSENTLCEIGELPAKLEDTKLRNITEFEKLFRYCKEEKSLYSILEGLPLLLTADNQLRVFDSKKAVYHSMFSDLFPDRTHLFVHPGLKCAYTFSEKAKKREVQESEVQEGEAQKSKAQKSKAQKCEAKNGETTESVPQVMRVFTLAELVKFIPDVLPSRFRDLSNHVPAQFPDKGVLSRDWFTRLWDYLENHAQDEQNEEQVRLTVLNEWAIIPTTCGKLVTVEMAKTVMDMTETGTESERERKVRAFLRKLKCPFLDKDITGGKSTETMNEETSSNCSKSQDVSQPAEQTTTNSTTKVIHREPAVTDPYVAHPHRVADVLEVLEYMRKTGTLDISIFSGEEMFEILQFFQDEYRSLHQKYNKILKDLPLYKSTDGTHTSLSAFSSYALLPPGVPLKGIEKLQSRTGCLFLHWDARHTLATLYDGLGVNIKLSVARFYINHLLRYFSMFDKESQMKYLEHLKKELPISREKKNACTKS